MSLFRRQLTPNSNFYIYIFRFQTPFSPFFLYVSLLWNPFSVVLDRPYATQPLLWTSRLRLAVQSLRLDSISSRALGFWRSSCYCETLSFVILAGMYRMLRGGLGCFGSTLRVGDGYGGTVRDDCVLTSGAVIGVYEKISRQHAKF